MSTTAPTITPTISIASDHAGVELKRILINYITDQYPMYDIHDCGPNTDDSVDYPDYGHALADTMKKGGGATLGIVICGTGIGISITANRHPHIRSALCHNGLTARLARRHDDANVLALGARVIGTEIAKDCVDEFLTTEFEGGRHARRVAKINPTG